MDTNQIYDKLRMVVISVRTKEQFLVALKFTYRTAKTTGNFAATTAHLAAALQTHPYIRFMPMPPPNRLSSYFRLTKERYNLNPEYLLGRLWP